MGVKAAGAQGWQPCHLHVPIVMKSGSLNYLEPSGPVKACNGIALPYMKTYVQLWQYMLEHFLELEVFPIRFVGKLKIHI
jgi:hypothetical protein